MLASFQCPSANHETVVAVFIPTSQILKIMPKVFDQGFAPVNPQSHQSKASSLACLVAELCFLPHSDIVRGQESACVPSPGNIPMSLQCVSVRI